MRERTVLAAIVISLAASGCALDEGDAIGGAREALSLSEIAGMYGCSTRGVEGISGQLLDEMRCLEGRAFMPFAPHTNITLESDRVHPFLSAEGVRMIHEASTHGVIQINSAFRTIAEQYVLSRTCSVAAAPGRSNHETGRAIDVANYGTVGRHLTAAGFAHPLPSSDPVHYEAPGDDLRGASVLAFQRLWNANHPTDAIDDDGVVGPQTMARLERAPATGFAIGRVCTGCMPDMEVCNMRDDDCDDEIDEEGVCTPVFVDAGSPTSGTDDAGVGDDADVGADAGVGESDASAGGTTDSRGAGVSGCATTRIGGRDRGGAVWPAAIAMIALGVARRRRARARARSAER